MDRGFTSSFTQRYLGTSNTFLGISIACFTSMFLHKSPDLMSQQWFHLTNLVALGYHKVPAEVPLYFINHLILPLDNGFSSSYKVSGYKALRLTWVLGCSINLLISPVRQVFAPSQYRLHKEILWLMALSSMCRSMSCNHFMRRNKSSFGSSNFSGIHLTLGEKNLMLALKFKISLAFGGLPPI